MGISIELEVNGASVSKEVEPRLLLAHLLREELGLTGTKIGCDTSQCGSCTILLDGQAVKSCTVLAVQADGSEITTIEGLANGEYHPVQQAFWDNHGLQCGFCTPGMIISLRRPAEHEPAAERRRDSPRAGGESVPLYRLSQYRASGAGCRRDDERLKEEPEYGR